MGKRALKHRVSLAVAGLKRLVLALLSALLVGCGGGGSGWQQPSLNPEPPGNEAPVFTSSTTATVDENQTAAYTGVATDPDSDALTYSLEGTDALFFSIDENTCVVSFRNVPDCENPGDEDRIYGKTDTDTVELADTAQGICDFVITAPKSAGTGRGMWVTSAGDVNGDGFDDLVIGSTPLDQTPTPTPGVTYVICGGQNVSANALVGTSHDDVLVGSSRADQIVGGQGDDILIGNGGADVLCGGAGDDILAIRDLSFASLDGGSGIDTLRFDAPLRLNFIGLSGNRISGVEKIDLRADGGNSHIILNPSDVLNLSDSSTRSNTLRIYGSTGDSVVLSIYSLAQRWVRSEQGFETDTWVSFGSGSEVLATVLVDKSINVSAPYP